MRRRESVRRRRGTKKKSGAGKSEDVSWESVSGGVGEGAVFAFVMEEGFAFESRAGDDFADEDVVIAAGEDMADVAFGVGECFGEDGGASLAVAEGDVGEFLGAARGEAVGEWFLLPSGTLTAKEPAFLRKSHMVAR